MNHAEERTKHIKRRIGDAVRAYVRKYKHNPRIIYLGKEERKEVADWVRFEMYPKNYVSETVIDNVSMDGIAVKWVKEKRAIKVGTIDHVAKVRRSTKKDKTELIPAPTFAAMARKVEERSKINA